MGIGPLLKTWRSKRRLSQLDLALEAGVSTRHLSFVETGRSRPSEQMVVHLAEQLDVPLRELIAARLEFPVAIEHDASAAALGERWRGAAREVARPPLIIASALSSEALFYGAVYTSLREAEADASRACEASGSPPLTSAPRC